MPYVSTEALVGAGLIVLLAFGYQHLTSTNSAGGSGAAKKKNKKSKKKTKTGGQEEQQLAPAAEVKADAPKPKGKGKKKAAAASVPAAPAPKAAEQSSTPSSSSSDDNDTEPAAPASFAAAAGGAKEPKEPAKPKLLAEKLLPKPRKTKVDDMLAPEDRPPQIARVMKIVPAEEAARGPHMVEKFAEDYAESSDMAEDGDESETGFTPSPAPRKPQNDGWNVVAAKKKPVSVSIGGGSSSGPSRANSNEPLTKVQRKNQKKAEMKKLAKEAEEADRLRRLAQHKRDLEREKINQIYNSQQKKVVRERGKVVSSGQAASLNTKGQLVWD